MIAVVADDLTGAVEIAGAGLRYGFTVEVASTISHQSPGVDLLVIATDTRSLPEGEAVKIMQDITVQLKALKPQLIFKKVDSVLRGHVIAELKAHLQLLDLERALLVPANPALGRIITYGQYFVDGQPIHLSSFADDPDFAITSAAIHAMLRTNKNEVAIKTTAEELPGTGIIVGECTNEAELQHWAAKADTKMLAAGGSGFFTAILEARGYIRQPVEQIYAFKRPALFVCGTTFNKSRQLVKQLKDAGGAVSYMPQDIIMQANAAENLYDTWADEVAALLKTHNKAIIAINAIQATANNLRQKQALLVAKVFERTAVKELLIEGGATAATIVKQLGFNRFMPAQEFGTGVVRMNVPQQTGLFLTLKPGSYNWPNEVWAM